MEEGKNGHRTDATDRWSAHQPFGEQQTNKEVRLRHRRESAKDRFSIHGSHSFLQDELNEASRLEELRRCQDTSCFLFFSFRTLASHKLGVGRFVIENLLRKAKFILKLQPSTKKHSLREF